MRARGSDAPASNLRRIALSSISMLRVFSDPFMVPGHEILKGRFTRPGDEFGTRQIRIIRAATASFLCSRLCARARVSKVAQKGSQVSEIDVAIAVHVSCQAEA